VVTSRNQLASLVIAEGAHPLTLDLLAHDESRELLARRLGPDRIAAEPAAVDEIIARCARLPLALAIVAARAGTHPQFSLQALAAELADRGDRLDALASGDLIGDVRAVFSWSYHALTPDAAGLFRLLGLHPGPDISAPAAASLAGHPAARVRPLLLELARANLVTEQAPGRYTFHDLLRAYAIELAQATDSDADRRSAIQRALDHYVHTACAAAVQLNPYRDPIGPAAPLDGVTPQVLTGYDAAFGWFTAEHAVLLRAVDFAAPAGFPEHTWQVAWALADFLERQGHWTDWANTQRLALAAAQQLADPGRQAHAHRVLARAYTILTQYGEAERHLRYALDLYRDLDDLAGQASTHLSMGPVFERQGRGRESLHHAQLAYDLFLATGHQYGQANALNSVGWCHAMLGEHEEALSCCEQALVLHRDVGDRHGEAATWDSLGYTHFAMGNHGPAATCYQEALDLYRAMGDRYEEAATLTNLGGTLHAAGRADDAREAWQQSLLILDDLDHPDADEVRAKLDDLKRAAASSRARPR
jgi:tetratricopeptide (TPR) repeat protein